MNIPKLRFKDNNGNDYPQWEKKKLGDTLLIQRGGSPRPISDYITNDKNGLNWIKIGDCSPNSNIITSTKEKIKPEGLSKTREVFVGDLILSNSMSFGRPYILNINGCIHDGWLLLRNMKKIYDLQFLCYILGSEYIIKQYKKLAAGSTVNNLNKDLVSSVIINIPQLKEQEKIAKFITTVDKKIENLKNTITSLENQKKGLLQQIFSQKLRFKDENGNNYPNWKENIESIKILSGNMYPTTSYINKPGILLIQGINITPNKLLLNDCIYISNDYNEINHVIVKKGDILLGLNRPLINNQLKICLFDKDFAYLYQRAGILSFNKLKINSLFLYQYLQTDSLKKHLQVELVGSDQPYIKSNIFNKIKLIFPCLEEQTKIADFLSAFDRKLDNQKAQLEHWQQIKKGLLQQMFV